MDYVIAAALFFYILYKVMVYFGRKNAIDVLCHNFQLDRKKISALKDKDITALHMTLESARSRAISGGGTQGEAEAITKLLSQYR
jgi:hypothetical protein